MFSYIALVDPPSLPVFSSSQMPASSVLPQVFVFSLSCPVFDPLSTPILQSFFPHVLSSFYFSALYTHSDHINTHIYSLETRIHKWERTCGLCLPRSYWLHLAENFTFLHDWIKFCSSRFTINVIIINSFANGHPGCF